MTAIPMQAAPQSLAPAVARQKSASLSLLAKFVILYMITYVFEGAVRFALSQAHLSSLLYLRDLLPVVVIGSTFLSWISGRTRPSVLLVTILIVAFHFFIGFFFFGHLFQHLFGLKVLLPMFLGVSLATAGVFNDIQLRKLATWMIVISVLGIVINYKFPYPWEGAEFETIFGSNTQSRLWTAGGVRRLSGFARASYDAASALLCGAVVVAATYRGILWRCVLLLAALLGIVLTTSKGAILAMIALVCMLLLSRGGRSAAALRFSVIVCAALLVIAPLLSFVMDIHIRDLRGNLAWGLSSYVERMEYTWPDAFKVLNDHGNLLIGRGIGGVGVSQLYGEGVRLYSPADNLFVYWTLACGMLGWVYGGSILFKLLRWKGISSIQQLLVYGFFVAVLTYGITANLMEQPIISFGLGYAIAVIFRPSREQSAAFD